LRGALLQSEQVARDYL